MTIVTGMEVNTRIFTFYKTFIFIPCKNK